MAQDYLPIQGSATPSECALSSASLTDSKHCNQLELDTFEALQNLKSVYYNGQLSATAKSLRHHHKSIVGDQDGLSDVGQ